MIKVGEGVPESKEGHSRALRSNQGSKGEYERKGREEAELEKSESNISFPTTSSASNSAINKR